MLQVPPPKKRLLQHDFTGEFTFLLEICFGLQRKPQFGHSYQCRAICHCSYGSSAFCYNREMRQEVSEHVELVKRGD